MRAPGRNSTTLTEGMVYPNGKTSFGRHSQLTVNRPKKQCALDCGLHHGVRWLPQCAFRNATSRLYRCSSATQDRNKCCPCVEWADRKGYHVLSCRKSLARLSRHMNVDVVVKRAFAASEIFSGLQPYVLLDVAPARWRKETNFCRDWEIYSLRRGIFSRWLSHKLQCRQPKLHQRLCKLQSRCEQNYQVSTRAAEVPFPASGFWNFGGWGKEASTFLRSLGVMQVAADGECHFFASVFPWTSKEERDVCFRHGPWFSKSLKNLVAQKGLLLLWQLLSQVWCCHNPRTNVTV